MSNTYELCCNLWAILDKDTQVIYALTGKIYALQGTDEEKLNVLRQLSLHDHQTTQADNLPERFTITGRDGLQQKRMTTIGTFYDPNSVLFEELFTRLELKLPATIDYQSAEPKEVPQKLPDDPLCISTLVIEDALGNRRSIVTDEDRAWLEENDFGSVKLSEAYISEVFLNGADADDTPVRDEINRYFNADMDLARADLEQNFYADNPEFCDLCNARFIDNGFFVDGAIKENAAWALMCTDCFGKHGKGIAWGMGQLYKNKDDLGWLQVGGFDD
jgi:hypothetical protein